MGCKSSGTDSGLRISSFTRSFPSSGSDSQLASALDSNPLVVAVGASSWSSYGGGVYRGSTSCGLNHQVYQPVTTPNPSRSRILGVRAGARVATSAWPVPTVGAALPASWQMAVSTQRCPTPRLSEHRIVIFLVRQMLFLND